VLRRHSLYDAPYQDQHDLAALQPEQVIMDNRSSKQVLLSATENNGVV